MYQDPILWAIYSLSPFFVYTWEDVQGGCMYIFSKINSHKGGGPIYFQNTWWIFNYIPLLPPQIFHNQEMLFCQMLRTQRLVLMLLQVGRYVDQWTTTGWQPVGANNWLMTEPVTLIATYISIHVHNNVICRGGTSIFTFSLSEIIQLFCLSVNSIMWMLLLDGKSHKRWGFWAPLSGPSAVLAIL